MKLTKTHVKTALRWTVQFGSGVIVGSIVSNNLSPELNPAQRVSAQVAGFAAGAALGDVCAYKTDQLMDELTRHN